MESTLPAQLHERRRFDPPAGLAATANVTAQAYEEAKRDRLGFWETQARRLSWAAPWHTPLEWKPPSASWFVGGKINVAYNCVDRHVEAGYGEQVAIYWEGEPGDRRVITYEQLRQQVCKAANALESLGVRPGDRVMIYLPMIPEALVSLLACARIGAVHSVVFGGFSPQSLRSRTQDAGAKVLITADGGYRRGMPHPLKSTADEAVAVTGIERMLVVQRTGQDVPWHDGRDIWWHDLVDSQSDQHSCTAFDAEHPLFILYTSGTTAEPKGILHTSGGYLTQTSYTHHAVFDHKPGVDVYWCAADIGWITGHSYIAYGPLSNRATQVMYEGTPNTPHQGRFWEIVDRYRVSILYTAPTVIRTFMRWGEQVLAPYDLSSLRLLGSVGEPINPEAWMWYREQVGRGRCPIVDTWWQTETGAIMISPLPGVTRTKPGSAQCALPGIGVDVVDESGAPTPNAGGYLALTQPWPAMLRGIWGDEQRYKDTYWARFAETGYYFAGDGAKRDADGDIWLLGRVDDVMNVSGHRISTAEVESALVSHERVAEAAVVGVNNPITGQAIVAFVILREILDGKAIDDTDGAELRLHVAEQIGAIAKPHQILVVPELPKTRSGKIMRRLLRDVADRRELGDTTTLADPSIMEQIGAALIARPAED